MGGNEERVQHKGTCSPSDLLKVTKLHEISETVHFECKC